MNAQFESLEARQLMSVTWNDHGTLLIRGTDGDDLVRVAKPNGEFVVTQNGKEYKFNASEVKRIVANLAGGDDRFSMHTASAKRVIVNGGDGDDNIAGGAGADQINGGAGNDALNGRSGSDVVDGGDGVDEICAVDFSQTQDSLPPVFSAPFSDTVIVDGDDAPDLVSYDPSDRMRSDENDQLNRDDGTRRPGGRPFEARAGTDE